MEEKNVQHAEEKRWVFTFDLKEESEEECLTEIGREFQMTGPTYWKDLSCSVLWPILGTQKIRIFEAERRERGEERRDEATQNGTEEHYQGQCGNTGVRAILY